MLVRAGIYRAELENFMGCGSFLLFRFSGVERGAVGPICYGNGPFAGEWEYKRFFKFCVCVLGGVNHVMACTLGDPKNWGITSSSDVA